MPYKPVIFVVISVLAIALIYSPSNTFIVLALPPDPKFASNSLLCKAKGPPPVQTCCWREDVPPGTGNPDLGGDQEKYCQTCKLDQNGDPTECTQKELQFFKGKLPKVTAPLQDGGVLQQPPTDQGTQPPKSGDTVASKDGGVVSNDQNPPKNKDTNAPPNDQGTKSGGSSSGNK